MDAARVQGTLWNVLYYVAGAVNRFLRQEPSNIIDNDPLQESTIVSRSGVDGHTAGFCKDKSDVAAWPPNPTINAWSGEDAQNTENKAPEQLDNSAKESVETFCSFTHLNLREKTPGNLKNSSGPKTQEKVENTDGFLLLASDRPIKLHSEDQLQVESQSKGLEGEGHEDNPSADNQSTTKILEQEDTRIPTTDVTAEEDIQSYTTEIHTDTITLDLKHAVHGSERQTKAGNVKGQFDVMMGQSEQVEKVEEELFSAGSRDTREEEVASVVPVKPEGKIAQELGGDFKNMPLSVCDVSRQLHTPTCEEPLPEHNNEAFLTQGFVEGEDFKEIQTHRHLQEEMENKEQESLQNSSRAKHNLILSDEMKATCASSKKRVKLSEQELDAPCGGLTGDNIEDLQEGIEVVELEQAQKLHDAAGDNSETGSETGGFSYDKLLDMNKEWMIDAVNAGGDLNGSSVGTAPEKSAVGNARNDTEEQDHRLGEEVTKVATDEAVKKVNDVLRDTATTVDLTTPTTCNAKETALCSVGHHRDVITEIPLALGIQTPSSEDNFDSKQDEASYENLSFEKREQQIRSDTESFIEISWDLLDQSFGESQASPCATELTAASAAFAVEQANVQKLLESNASASLKTDSELRSRGSEVSLKKLARCSGETLKISQSLDKVEETKCEVDIQTTGIALNFAPQRSRMAVKNPHVRPPKDRRSLLMRPSMDPVCPPPQPTSKISTDVHALGALGFGIKLPGLGSGFPVLKKLPKMQEAEPKPVPKADATKQADVPHKPKWMPPRQTGFGNPFMSELKTKLKKATKN
ncbi:uncharacterized protein si:ch211-136m16.8 isoform X1 [Phycodurus eques]|uniref:uncharacterized protein si:ch211-136m16.8 isoform X1 n=1 Tax=Phycodurus eques TaxID=693459 RepID=UPI002ACECEBB|nr:uncharacterized protein si:ch211-136m16.8 isoform X1 [Phycodurus eques]